MAYCVDIYRFPNSTEYEVKWAGNYGGPGERRQKKKKATHEQIKKQNQWKKETYVRRLMKLNFKESDLWCTMLYPKGTRKSIEEVKKDVQGFLRKIRQIYKKRDTELRFMYRIEIGKRGGIHIHLICNHVDGTPPVDVELQKAWKHGRISFERFGGEEEDYQKLGDYLVKPQAENVPDEVKKCITAFSTSRNLKRPKPERKEYKRRTVRKILQSGPVAKKGFYIDKKSIISGVNKFTGLSYLYYTEVRIEPGGSG